MDAGSDHGSLSCQRVGYRSGGRWLDLVQLAAVFLISPLSSPCVFYYLVLHWYDHGTLTISISSYKYVVF